MLRTAGLPAIRVVPLSAGRAPAQVSRRRPLARGSAASRPAISSRAFNRGFGHSGVGVRIRTNGRGSNCYCYGYGCMDAYGWGYGGFYDPYWWSDSGSSFDYDQQYQTGLANEMNQQSLDEQRMRQQGDQDLYAGSAPAPPREHREHEELNEPRPPRCWFSGMSTSRKCRITPSLARPCLISTRSTRRRFLSRTSTFPPLLRKTTSAAWISVCLVRPKASSRFS